jgi:hypothetical protein
MTTTAFSSGEILPEVFPFGQDMEALSSGEPVGPIPATDPAAALESHPFVLSHPNLQIVGSLMASVDTMATHLKTIVDKHQEDPFDIIVGDDVSGRVPTLIAHRFLRLAQAAGHIDTVPHTLFMASGEVPHRIGTGKIEQAWRANLTTYAGRILGQIAAKKVLILTESSVTGNSLDRIKEAFAAHGVEASDHTITTGLYLWGYKHRGQDRKLVGVEKRVPDPVTQRRRRAPSGEAADLRHFLNDYTDVLYQRVFGQPPAPNTVPKYRAARVLQPRPKVSWLRHAVQGIHPLFRV